MEIYEEELKALIADMELMTLNEINPDMKALRSQLIARLKLHINVPELPQNRLPGRDDGGT